MAKYVLRRNSDGKIIETTSATTANDLVANGVAKMVKNELKAAPAPAPKTAPKSSDSESK